MSQEIVVTTGARLHFGLLAVKPAQGRRFGGTGVMIDAPGYRLRFQPASSDCRTGDQVSGGDVESRKRVTSFLQRLRNLDKFPKHPAAIVLEQVIPSHAGLGSGTQLGLATAAGVLALSGVDTSIAKEFASSLGRGTRSSIGIHGFYRGGFLAESGKASDDELSPLVARAEIPPNWRWVLVAPQAVQGLSGTPELKAFSELSPMPRRLTDRLCGVLMMEWLPAMLAADFETASQAMWSYGSAVGEYFSQVQGGMFASPVMEQIACRLRNAGIRGIAQTSWGPTIAILARHEAQSREIIEQVQAAAGGRSLRIQVAVGRNRGAEILSISPQPGFEPSPVAPSPEASPLR